MDQQKNYQQNSHGNGFILGVIVGVLIALLFTTKKGREILKEVTDKGIKKWSDLEQTMKEMEEKEVYDDEIDEPSEYVAPEEKKEIQYLAKEHSEVKAEVKEPAVKVEAATEKKEEVKKVEEEIVEKKTTEKTLTGRRWFRGLRKKA